MRGRERGRERRTEEERDRGSAPFCCLERRVAGLRFRREPRTTRLTLLRIDIDSSDRCGWKEGPLLSGSAVIPGAASVPFVICPGHWRSARARAAGDYIFRETRERESLISAAESSRRRAASYSAIGIIIGSPIQVPSRTVLAAAQRAAQRVASAAIRL